MSLPVFYIAYFANKFAKIIPTNSHRQFLIFMKGFNNMSVTYPNLPHTNFPDSIDPQYQMSDIEYGDLPLIKQYYDLVNSENISAARDLLRNNPQLNSKIYNADKFNKLHDSMIAMQQFIRDFGFSGSGLKMRGLWDSRINYSIGDVVSHNNSIWQAVTNNSNSSPSLSNTDWIEVMSPTGKGGMTWIEALGNKNVSSTNTKNYQLKKPTPESGVSINDINYNMDLIDLALFDGLESKINKSGGSLTGKLTTSSSTSASAPIRIPHGSDPTAPNNGDLWSTVSGLFTNINGATRTIYHNGNASTANLTTVSQTEAEAGTSTALRAWTPQRVAQAAASVAASSISSGIVIGSYTGNQSGELFVNLGFTPKIVIVMNTNSNKTINTEWLFCARESSCYGGIAITGFPAVSLDYKKVVEIVTNGFKVFYQSQIYSNDGTRVYIAFK